MRTLIATLMVSGFALGGFTAAHAADAVEQVPQPPVAQEAPPAINNWSGFYIGGTGSYNMGHFNHNGNSYAWGGSAFTGYNWQQGQIVYGIEGDLGYADSEATRNGLTAKNGVNGSVRGRIGYDFNPFMLYGTAGLALGQNKLEDATSSESKTAVGYTVGAGAETFITNNITARLEYRFTDYGRKDFHLDSGSFSRGYDENSVKVGIGVKF
ncbi:porin family protein [Rhizobium calliandrae]|uniref:Porin family protein n=1 Tax=Rhizobium calliandrae TaxID=1312182 RepID=A0ABT7K7G7_9HYPH|nr:outer membrane protein [Rhizobium calliandrae]MDL2404549.1 porin family protein [Rhizobium calliandrae]